MQAKYTTLFAFSLCAVSQVAAAKTDWTPYLQPLEDGCEYGQVLSIISDKFHSAINREGALKSRKVKVKHLFPSSLQKSILKETHHVSRKKNAYNEMLFTSELSLYLKDSYYRNYKINKITLEYLEIERTDNTSSAIHVSFKNNRFLRLKPRFSKAKDRIEGLDATAHLEFSNKNKSISCGWGT